MISPFPRRIARHPFDVAAERGRDQARRREVLERAPIPLKELEKRAILDAIEYFEGDVEKAARALGISRAKIYQRRRDWRKEEAAGMTTKVKLDLPDPFG